MKINVIARYIVLLMALVNQWLANKGISPIPVDEETISLILLAGVSFFMADKDNPRTKEGNWANQKLKKYKAEKKYTKATGQAPIKADEEPTSLDELKNI